jgi:hypothetical protein
MGDVLRTLGALARWCDETGRDRLQRDLQAADRLFAPRVAARAKALLQADGEATVLSGQVVLNLAVRALACCDVSPGRRASANIDQQLGPLLLGLGEHLHRDLDEAGSMTLELTRLGLFFAIYELAAWLEIAHELFCVVAPTMTDHSDWIDLDELVRDSTTLSLERMWALTVMQGMHAHARGTVMTNSSDVEWDVTQPELDAWMSAWSRSLADASAVARVDLPQSDGWSFSSLSDRPVLYLSDEEHLVVRPSWLARKGVPAEFFWQLRDRYVDSGGDHEQLSRFFGAAMEQVGWRMLARDLPAGSSVLHETDIARWSGGVGSRCDAVVVEGGSTVALDFVFRQFTRATHQTGNISDLGADLEKAVLKKVRQIDKSLLLGLEGGHVPEERIFPVVVVGAPFPVNPLIYSEVDARAENDELSVVTVHPTCRPVTVLDFASFHTALKATDAGTGLADLLDQWLQSDLSSMPFRDWIAASRNGGTTDFTWGDEAWKILGLPEPADRRP